MNTSKLLQLELADLLGPTLQPAQSVTQKFSQAAKPTNQPQMPGSQLLERHYSAFGGIET